MDLPGEFCDRLRAQLSEEDFRWCLVCMGAAERTLFRINGLKGGREEVLAELERAGFEVADRSNGLAECFEVPAGQRRLLTESKAFYEGRIYIQNPSSQIAARLLGARRGEMALDLAAAPGGKTLALAEMMGNEGCIRAVEPIKGRYFKLRANLERGGARIVDTFMMDGRAAGKRWPASFDRVLLDAPCSSEARFIPGDPSSWEHWSLRKIRETSRKQKRLIVSAFEALRPGGVLLYSTCSFAPEENEGIVQSLIKRAGEAVSVLPLELELPNVRPALQEWRGKAFRPDVANGRRFLPDGLFDGFFVSLLRREA